MSDFGEWLSEVIITLKTNIFFTAFSLAPKLCNYKSAKNHVFTRNKKVDTPQRVVIKKEINKNFLTLAITSTCTSQSLGKNLGTMFSHITCSPPKIWITIDCFQFLLCITVVPREIEENGLQNVFLFFSFFEGEGGGEQGVLWSMWKWWITTETVTLHRKNLSFSISRKNPWVRGCWYDTNKNRKITLGEIPYGLAVRIPGFHPGGPGSTPGMGKNAFYILLQ